MYNNSTPQYPAGYNNSYPYQYGMNYGYPGYGYQSQQPVPPTADSYQASNWSQGQTGYSSVPQPPVPSAEPKEEVVQEIQQQKATLTKQREDYVKKALVLRRELDELKRQKHELGSDDRSEKDLKYVLKENERLQDEITGKLKAILNVVEMLSSIIKDGKKIYDLEAELEKQIQRTKEESLQKNEKSTKMYSPKKEEEINKDQKFCYVYYDTGLHWCRACDKFPETAKEFLQHLHSPHHQDRAKEQEVDTTPWHKLPVEPLLASFEDAPKKRIPIKGLQFFISAPSWYCKLCDFWIGDLHCASHHLKSQVHFQNYENFVKQNPQWETEWLKDREKAMMRSEKNGEESSDSEKSRKKKRRHRKSSNESFLKEKKKKKRSKKKKQDSSDSSSSSSSSSDSSSDEEDENTETDKGKSIRVAMRNIQQVKSIMDEDMSKWSILEKLVHDVRKKDGEKKETKEREEELINHWVTVTHTLPDKEKNLLETLKDRMKAKQDLEKAKLLEYEIHRREKEREEQENYEKKRKAREEAERVEREKKRKEQEANKVLDKERSHVRFKTSRKRSPSNDRRNSNERSHKENRDNRESPPSSRRRRSSDRKSYSPNRDHDDSKRKSSNYRKLPFIGRMPLFKNKRPEPKSGVRSKEIKVEEYEPTRKTRFEAGNLTRAYIPKPDVVCFPVLSSIPPISAPPEPTAVEEVAPPMQEVTEPPKTPSTPGLSDQPPPPPPPPPAMNNSQKYENMEYSEMDEEAYYQMYQVSAYDTVPHPPLEPPPMPPEDDLAMLGICADDMAAQSF